jgi:hypothetical protein
MGKCRFKIGLLNLRDCGNDAIYQCGECNRPICSHHFKEAAGGIKLCLECHASKLPEGAAADEDVNRLRYRNSIYHAAHYRPYYFDHGPSYGLDDYESFEDGEGTETETESEELSQSHFQDS